ncbi:MAG: aminotransferase class I/II-fold pyridoxal phosphate-dependent enzyme, partial [Bacteroidales bacterium]
MIYGHGDDTFSYPEIQVNFSSNCCCNVNNEYLIRHLQQRLAPLISAYPHPSGLNLRKKIADCEQIPETRVAVFNGATEAIYTIARFIESNKVYIAGPTFSEYEAASTATGKSIEKIYLQDLITGKVSQFEKRSMVWLCNPNNPDGVHFPKNRLQELINSNPDTWFVIDQSYADFIDFPVIYPADAKNNVILVYSLTKQYT